jgi:hypothetical protein
MKNAKNEVEMSNGANPFLAHPSARRFFPAAGD